MKIKYLSFFRAHLIVAGQILARAIYSASDLTVIVNDIPTAYPTPAAPYQFRLIVLVRKRRFFS
jgi:hypothetical protein